MYHCEEQLGFKCAVYKCNILAVVYRQYSVLYDLTHIVLSSDNKVVFLPHKENTIKLIWGLLIGRIIIKLQVTGRIAFAVSNSRY